jgi:hypothetical protein
LEMLSPSAISCSSAMLLVLIVLMSTICSECMYADPQQRGRRVRWNVPLSGKGSQGGGAPRPEIVQV